MLVTVFNTTGAQETSIQFDGSTKAELAAALTVNGINFDNMSFITGETEVTLESANAQTPTTDFTLFLVPKKVDSGNDDDDFDDDQEFDTPEVITAEPAISQETAGFIKQLEDSILLLQGIISKLKDQKITDPHILAMQHKAAMLMQNRKG